MISLLRLFILAAGVFCSSAVFSTTSSGRNTVLGLDLGFSVTNNPGYSASFPLGYSTFNYTNKNGNRYPLRFGVSLGRQFQLNPFNSLQLGVSYLYNTNMKGSGVLEQGITPPFYPFTYSYLLHSSQVLAEGKWLHQWREVFYPYLIGGIGVAINRAFQYKTSIPPSLTLTPNYLNKSTSAFSYMLGLGIDFFISQTLSFGGGYRFSDLGRVGLGDGIIRSSVISSQLQRDHVYLNTILVEMHWYF